MRNEELLEKEKNIAWDYTNSACRKKKQEGSGRQAVSVRRIPGMFSFLSLVILISFHVIAYFLRVLDWRVQDDCSKETRETSNLYSRQYSRPSYNMEEDYSGEDKKKPIPD
jgi:hypothetical protein